MDVNTNIDSLINKKVTIPEVKTKHFDNDEYTITKKTKKGLVKVLKPEVIEEIKRRLEEQ